MIKTGTITFHAPINYGAFLQAYALQKTIQEKIPDCDNQIIDFRSEKQKKQYSLFFPPISKRNIARDIYTVRRFRQLRSRRQKFESAKKQHLILTSPCATEDEVKEKYSEFDVMICGSDQIWNTELNDYSDAFFLPDAANKISYAASLGKQISSRTEEKIRKYINGFSSVSVRETHSAATVSAHYQNPVQIVCDPVLLVPQEDWISFAGKGKHNDPYVLLYSIGYSDQILQIAKQIGEHFHLPVITPFGSMSAYAGSRLEKKGIQVDYSAGPNDFVRYINEARYVVTDSFHGTVFSLLLHKPFSCIRWADKNGHIAKDERIDSLLQTTELDDRIISTVSQFEENIVPFRWSNADEKIEQIKQNSITWLKEAILSAANKGSTELVLRKEGCCGCGACEQICPKRAITMEADAEGFLYPSISKEKCVHCGLCRVSCPFKKEKLKEK